MSGLGFEVRQLRHRFKGGFVWIGVLALAFGIGTSTAAFDLLNASLLRPLPVQEPDRLIGLYRSNEQRQGHGPLSYPDYLDYRRRAQSLEDLAAYTQRPFVFVHEDQATRTWGGVVSQNYFDVLGLQAERGRFFLGDDKDASSSVPVVLSYDFWQERFNGDPGILGTEVSLNRESTGTVVGIAPEGFQGTVLEYSLDFWRPIPSGDELLEQRGARWLNVLIGRLRDGVALRQAEAELRSIAAGLAEAHPETHEASDVNVEPLRLIAPPPARRQGFLLYGVLLLASLLVLVVASNNLISLLVARAFGKRRDTSVCQALGASRWDAGRPFLLEGILFALVAAIGGVLFAHLARARVHDLLPAWRAPLNLDLSPDLRTVGFLGAIVLLVALGASLAPAFVGTRSRFVEDIQEGGKSTPGRGAAWIRRGLVASQVPVAMVLMVVSGMMLRSLHQASRVNVGFDAQDVVVFSLETELQNLGPERTTRLYGRLVDFASTLPGVETVAVAQGFPFGNNWGRRTIWIPGLEAEPQRVLVNVVNPDYFSALDIPLLQGRRFEQIDDAQSPVVGIVNSAFAERFSFDSGPVGQRIRFDSPEGEELQIVGVVASSRYRRLRQEPAPMLYLTSNQSSAPNMSLLVESSLASTTIVDSLRQELRQIAPEVPSYNVGPLTSFTNFFVWQQRMIGFFATVLGGVTLVLGCLGVFGIIDYFTRRRTREIAVRMALGANRPNITSLVLWQGLLPIATGLAIGLLAAVAISQLMLTRFLFAIGPLDPIVYLSVSVLLLLMAMLATWYPAYQAARVQPMHGLRTD